MRLTDSRILHIVWGLNQPIAPPGGYRLQYEYRQFAGHPASIRNEIKLHSLQQSCQLGPIPPETQWKFILFAIYNEASLDPGLEFFFKDDENMTSNSFTIKA